MISTENINSSQLTTETSNNTTSSSFTSDYNIFDSLVEKTNMFLETGIISEIQHEAKIFIINRMRYYTEKIDHDEYTIHPYFKFINYMPSICRKFFTALTINNSVGRSQDIKKGCLYNHSLWSWSSSRKNEEGKRVFVYIVTAEQYLENKNLQSEWVESLYEDLENETLTICEKINNSSGTEKEDLIAKLQDIQKQQIEIVNRHIAEIIESMHFFESRSDAKDYIINNTKRFIIFQNPSDAKARRKSRNAFYSEGISDAQEL